MQVLLSQPEQTIKYKTFEEICPTWARILSNGEDTNEIGLSNRCIVGEAWKWSNEYYLGRPNECKECIYYSDMFAILSARNLLNLNSKSINNFTKHYNKCHVNI